MSRRVRVIGAAFVAVVALASCRPEVEFDLDGRQSEIDAVTVDASVLPDGVVRVAQRYRLFGVQIVGYVISFISGYTLTNRGWRERALWRSFARYIDDRGEIKKVVGPAGVVVWGPYLVYGAVLGEATAAARPLTP